MQNQSLAIKAFDYSSLCPKCRLDATSLTLPDDATFESCQNMLSAMQGLGNCTKWWIGDVLVHAERAFGEKYAQLLDASDFEYGALRNICYTATQVAPSVRRKELTFWHHREVAALLPNDQRKFLKIAVDQKLSAAALRALIQNKDKEPKPKKSETFELALRSILKIAQQSPDFDKVAFKERPSKMDEIIAIAVTADDALRAFEE
jgi:hypothetical protein